MKPSPKKRKRKALPPKKRAQSVHVMPSPETRPGTYSRDLKIRRRSRMEKTEINVRFATRGEYEVIKAAAGALNESMNLFITTAALNRAKVPESPAVPEAVAQS